MGEGDAAIDQGDDIIGVDFQNLPEAAQRRVDLPQMSQHQSAVIERGDVARVPLEDLREACQRPLRRAASECRAALLEQRLHLYRHRAMPYPTSKKLASTGL